MRFSSLFTHTLREAPSSAELVSHQLLCRAGYFQEIGKGGFAILPFGMRALQQIENAFLKRLELPSSRIVLPSIVVHEGSQPDTGGLIFPDPQGRQLQMTASFRHTFQELARVHLSSYKQLPASVHASGPRWTGEVHPGSGLLYSRMPQTLELSAFFASSADLQTWHLKTESSLNSLLEAVGFPLVQSSALSSSERPETLEWYFAHPSGRTTLFLCSSCGYTASREHVRFVRNNHEDEPPLPLEVVETPDCKTIDALASFLQVPKNRTAKAVFLAVEPPEKEHLVIAVVPGDRELDEKRLSNAMGGRMLRPATESEIVAAGAVPGYGSPIGVQKAFIAVDAQIPFSPNLVAGANRSGFHYLHANYGRDYRADLVAEISMPNPGDRCPKCGQEMQTQPALLIAELATQEITHGIMDPQGKIVPLNGLSCSLHTMRLLAAVAETFHDAHGLIMPAETAPFIVHLTLLHDKTGLAEEAANRIAQNLEEAGFEPLYDDRPERAGVKFNDADLIGIPCRITVSQRALAEGCVELKMRNTDVPRQIPLEEITSFLLSVNKEKGV